MSLFEEIYEADHGHHFSEKLYKCATAKMVNEDGTIGPHWGVSEIENYAKGRGMTGGNYNEYDLAYVMNMIYSDYYGAVPDSTDNYFKLARAFLNDKDAPEGKAYLYWKAMNR